MVQTVAKELNVPKEIISMKPVNSFVSPQNSPSWGSFTTDCMCSSAIVACQSLKERLKEVEDTMDHPTWIELIKECHKRKVDLTVRHQYDFNDRNQKLIITDCFSFRGLSSNELENPNYEIYSATVSEVELDVLTGEICVRRVDILEDTGTSINPEIDVGQVEGAFVMSLGMWLTEQLRYDPMSGKLLTCDTWVSKTHFDFKLSNFENLLKNIAGIQTAIKQRHTRRL